MSDLLPHFLLPSEFPGVVVPSKLPVLASLSQSQLLGSQTSDTSLRLDAGQTHGESDSMPLVLLVPHSGRPGTAATQLRVLQQSPRGETRTFNLSDTCTHKSRSKEIPILTPTMLSISLCLRAWRKTQLSAFLKNITSDPSNKEDWNAESHFPGMWEGDWG